MLSSTSTTLNTTTTTTTTYTTIPISARDVISRSLQNLSSAFSLLRPLSELLNSGGFDRPASLASTKLRLLRNVSYFCLNYALIVLSCAILSLIQAPLSLIIISAVVFLWLIFYWFREDPLMLWDRHVSDRLVLAGLVAVSILSVWGLGVFWNLVIGAATGVGVMALHGVLRNENGVFLDEQEAASQGLISSERATVI